MHRSITTLVLIVGSVVGLASSAAAQFTRTATAPVQRSTTYPIATRQTTITPISIADLDLACLYWQGSQGVLDDPRVFVRKHSVGLSSGTVQSLLYAPTWGMESTSLSVGGVREHRGEWSATMINGIPALGIESMNGADGVALFARGANETLVWQYGQPFTSSAMYTVAFVYDLPEAPCDAELVWEATPSFSLPEGYRATGVGDFNAYAMANTTVRAHIDPEGKYLFEPFYAGDGAYAANGDVPFDEILGSFVYTDCDNADPGFNAGLHPIDCDTINSDATAVFEEFDGVGIEQIEEDTTPQLVIEFNMVIGPWCTGTCDPTAAVSNSRFGNVMDLQDVDLRDHLILSVTTDPQGSANAETGVRYWMSRR